MKKFITLFAIASMALFTSCSADDNEALSVPDEPNVPEGQLKLGVKIEQGNYPVNHIKIYKVVAGQNLAVNEMTSNGAETAPWAYVEIGDHIRVKYAIGIRNEPLTLKYHIMQGNTELKSDSATIVNHNPPFAEFFDITISND